MSNSNSIPLPTNPRFKDLTGNVFERLTVMGYAGHNKYGQTTWRTACECGVDVTIPGSALSLGRVKSCGCLRVEVAAQLNATHGMGGTPEYLAWHDMWRRCTVQEHPAHHLYKDRTPPPEWRSFEAFYAELGPRPGKGYSLDRIDNDKPYGPGNCRWTTSNVQNRNKSTNVWVTTPGGQRLCLKDACALIGVAYGTVTGRRGEGQTIEEASNGLLREAA